MAQLPWLAKPGFYSARVFLIIHECLEANDSLHSPPNVESKT